MSPPGKGPESRPLNRPSSPSLARFAGIAAATSLVACAAGAWPTYALDGTTGLIGMGVGAVLTLVGAIGGYLPLVSRAAASSVEARAQAWMMGLGIRLFLTMGVLFGLWSAEVFFRSSLMVWTGILYFVLLMIETLVVARSMRAFDPPRASA